MGKLLFWRNEDAGHRAEGDALTDTYPQGFVPRHCAGQLENGSCLAHDHPGEAPMVVFAGIGAPVTRDARGQVVS